MLYLLILSVSLSFLFCLFSKGKTLYWKVDVTIASVINNWRHIVVARNFAYRCMRTHTDQFSGTSSRCQSTCTSKLACVSCHWYQNFTGASHWYQSVLIIAHVLFVCRQMTPETGTGYWYQKTGQCAWPLTIIKALTVNWTDQAADVRSYVCWIVFKPHRLNQPQKGTSSDTMELGMRHLLTV